MKHWQPLQQIIGTILALWLLAGCSASATTVATPSPTHTEVISTPTPTEVPLTPTPVPPTPTPVPTLPPSSTPVPGQWQANGNELGTFEFTVNSNSTAITKIVFQIPKLSCHGMTIQIENANIQNSWPVNNGHFTLDAVPNPLLDVTLTGQFNTTRHVVGTWKLVILGQTCPGTWTGNSVS